MGEYHSKYCTDKKVSAPQYIAELVCENIAAQDGKALPLQFWRNPEWGKIFKWQVVLASRLLKKHTATVIIKALRTYKGKRVISLKASFILSPLIKKIQAEEKTKVCETTINAMSTTKKPRTPKKKKTLLESLDE